MARQVTAEEIEKLVVANESVKGTPDYTKYYNSCEFKIKGKTNWVFSGWYPITSLGPNQEAFLKKIKHNYFLYIKEPDGRTTYRYGLSDESKVIFNLS